MNRSCHHCDEFSRATLLRRGAAEAGRGTARDRAGHAGARRDTGLDRRSFVAGAFGLALSVYGLGKLRLFEDGIAQAASGPAQPVLVSVFLPGGADSLSVLYPALDPNYRKLRPTLALPDAAGPAFSEDTRLHWHPKLQPLATLHGEGKVSVMPAIGYTHPDQSHFTSRHFWEVGATDARLASGWMGRYLDHHGTNDNPLQGLSLDYQLQPVAGLDRRCRSPRWPRPTSTRSGRRASGARSRTGCSRRSAALGAHRSRSVPEPGREGDQAVRPPAPAARAVRQEQRQRLRQPGAYPDDDSGFPRQLAGLAAMLGGEACRCTASR